MSVLSCIGIFPVAIEDAIDVAKLCYEMAGLTDYRELDSYAEEVISLCGDWSNITNSIIDAYFCSCKELVEKSTDHKVDYYVNCYDSHIYLDDEEVL